MAKWKIIVSIILAAASVIMAAAKHWLAGSLMLLIAAIVVVFYMLTLKKGGNLFSKIGFIILGCCLVFVNVYDVFNMIASIPNYLIISEWGMMDMIMATDTTIHNTLMQYACIFPLIYCLVAKRKIKEKSVG